MLARAHRLSEPGDIKVLSRGGQRVSSRFFVARLHRTDTEAPSRFAFIVSKQVGGAVIRNKVKRRLRALAQSELVFHPTGWDVVVRALPAAGPGSFEDLERSWRGAFREGVTA